MKIGRKILTLAAMAALTVSTILAQGTPAKPSSQTGDAQTTSSQPSKKKAGKHGHHHKKNKKHASSTPTQDTTTKK